MQVFFFAKPGDVSEMEDILRRDQGAAMAEWIVALEQLT